MSGVIGHRGLLLGAGSAPVIPSTWDPAKLGPDLTLSNTDHTVTKSANDALKSVLSTQGKSAGKWYFEIGLIIENGGAQFKIIGVAADTVPLTNHFSNDALGWGYYQNTGEKVNAGTLTAFGSAWAAGNILQVALDMTAGKIWFGLDNTWQGSGNPTAGTNPAFTGLTGTVYAAAALYQSSLSPDDSVTGRFSAGSQSFAPPTGFTAWG